jgi:hypothetical protein
VYAIEKSRVAETAAELIEANSFRDRITLKNNQLEKDQRVEAAGAAAFSRSCSLR